MIGEMLILTKKSTTDTLVQVDTIGMMLSDLVHAEDHPVLNCMLTENSTHAALVRMRDTMSPFVRSSEKVKYKVSTNVSRVSHVCFMCITCSVNCITCVSHA